MARFRFGRRALQGAGALLAVLAGASCASSPSPGSGAVTPTRPSFTFGRPVNLGAVVNTRGFDGGPSPSADGRKLFFVSDRPGGQGGGDIWVTRRSSPGGRFGRPRNLGPAVNSLGNEGAPSISSDGRTLYFDCFEPGPGAPCFQPDFGDPDVWMASRRSLGGPFQPARSLGEPVDTSSAEGFPAISADGRTLYFASDRPGGSGGTDLWQATRASTAAPFAAARNLGPAVNSAGYDGEPAISADGLVLFFASDRRGGSGGPDLWVATRPGVTEPFGTPVNLGPAVNTAGYDGRPALSGDGSTLYFMSDRPGGFGSMDLYQVTVTGHQG